MTGGYLRDGATVCRTDATGITQRSHLELFLCTANGNVGQ